MVIEKRNTRVVVLAWVRGFRTKGHVVVPKFTWTKPLINFRHFVPEREVASLGSEVGAKKPSIVVKAVPNRSSGSNVRVYKAVHGLPARLKIISAMRSYVVCVTDSPPR